MTRASTASVQKLSSTAGLFAALGDPVRLRIVSRLCETGPLSIVRLTQGASISRQAITKHLRALSDAGLVHCARAGRESRWRIETRRLADAERYLAEISSRWDEALSRLKALVELDVS